MSVSTQDQNECKHVLPNLEQVECKDVGPNLKIKEINMQPVECKHLKLEIKAKINLEPVECKHAVPKVEMK